MLEVAQKNILNTGMINWQKQKNVYEIIHKIRNYQVTPYYFKKIEDMYDYLLQLDTVTLLMLSRFFPKDVGADNEKWLKDVLYDLSLRLKPSKTRKQIYNDFTEI
jgi:hypothetical protein